MEKVIVEKTYYPKQDDLEAKWILVDATDHSLGRLATQIASYLMGKHKPTFTPGAPVGDYVVVVNAEKLSFTRKRLVNKMYYRHSGYPGGLTETTLRVMLEKHPERVIYYAVKGMLPHNRHGRKLLKRLKVYAGSDHPHLAQNPQPAA